VNKGESMDTKIHRIHARHLIDCKCRGLLEVDIFTGNGALGRASAPTGTSVGSHEAMVIRDSPPGRFLGTSVFKALDIVNNIIAPAIIGLDAADQKKIDECLLELDGTPLKSRLGGNSIYSVSAACAMAAANALRIPIHHYWKKNPIEKLPLPICNMFNGGKYRDVQVEIQEFGIIPYGAKDMQEAVEIAITTFNEVGNIIRNRQKGFPPAIANYFGHMPISSDPSVLLEIIAEAVEVNGYTEKVCYSIDCAANEFYDTKKRTYNYMGKEVDSTGLIGKMQELTSKYNFLFVEDILSEDDFEGFAQAACALPNIRIVGDDLICTNTERLRRALQMRACDGIIFKPNQIGTITECMSAYELARYHDILVIPSVRAGGTIDDPVKDMAIALQVPLVKCGAPRSGERISFLNTLLRAADEFPESLFHPLFDNRKG
jgi:enolase